MPKLGVMVVFSNPYNLSDFYLIRYFDAFLVSYGAFFFFFIKNLVL